MAPPEHKRKLLDEYVGLLQKSGASVMSAPLPAVTAGDALVMVDMQNDFLPADEAPSGGRFGVPEGAAAGATCIRLMELFASKGAKIIASKDYHPKDHISFNVKGGPFPEHCIQGSPGSEFYPPIGKALNALKKQPGSDLHIVHKGFHEDIDSFGAFPYKVDQVATRLSCSLEDTGCCSVWTGGYELKCSNQEDDIDAPPDILSILEERRKNMRKVLDEGAKGDPLKRRVFVCGLAMDFCCLDTMINAANAGYTDVHLVIDGSRAANIPGVGKFGSGFLTDPAYFVKQLNDNGIKICTSAALGIK